MVINKAFKTLMVRSRDKVLFIKLNSDWNVLNPTLTKTKEEFFRMMLNIFHEELKKLEKKK